MLNWQVPLLYSIRTDGAISGWPLNHMFQIAKIKEDNQLLHVSQFLINFDVYSKISQYPPKMSKITSVKVDTFVSQSSSTK